MNEKKLGISSVISTGAGLIVATSCLMTIGQGAGQLGITFIISMLIACAVNICSVLSFSELNALMPNITGGLAQYTLACCGPFITIVCMVGGYILANTICGSVECAMFGTTINTIFATDIPSSVFCVALILILMIFNLLGVEMFARIQNAVVVFLLGSMFAMGFIGAAGLGTGERISQPYVIDADPSHIISMSGLAFFLFMGCEFAISISKEVKDSYHTLPKGMVLSLLLVMGAEILIIFGMHNYVPWAALQSADSPHVLYGQSILGNVGVAWMILVSIFAAVSTLNSIINSLAFIMAGMAKMDLLPSFFAKKNKRGAYPVGIVLVSVLMMFLNVTGLSNSDEISFFILIIAVFWILAYIVANVDVLILRHRLPKAPRNFKLPGKGLIPILGIAGNILLVANIDQDPAVRFQVYRFCIIVLALISAYALLWVRFHMKKRFFKSFPIPEVMALEDVL